MDKIYVCAACSLENPFDAFACSACDSFNPNHPIFIESTGGSKPTGHNNNNKPSCPQCSFELETEDDPCPMCFQAIQPNVKRSKSNNNNNLVVNKVKVPPVLVDYSLDSKDALLQFHREFQESCQQLASCSSSVQVGHKRRAQVLMHQIYSRLEYKKESNEQPNTNHNDDECQVCYSSFDEKETVAMQMDNCDHKMICTTCLTQYLTVRIKDEHIMPWIPCPREECLTPMHPHQFDILNPTSYWQFLVVYMQKKLSRNDNFIPCQGKNCRFGFIQFVAKSESVTCPICQHKQTIERGKFGELDETFKKMIADGLLRPCPNCKTYADKEKGICNIMNCRQCGCWWNWRTHEVGQSQRELKERARTKGTLWEPGELEYQQELEENDPDEFKKLLARNGIVYQKNYIRGH